jgi:hypothetical protein
VAKGYRREDLYDPWMRYLGGADVTPDQCQQPGVNTEDVIKEEGLFSEPGRAASWPPYETATSATGATGASNGQKKPEDALCTECGERLGYAMVRRQQAKHVPKCPKRGKVHA